MRNGLVVIGLLLWFVGGGCSSSAKDTESPLMPSWELSQIDSLMPHRPDSALALLCGDVARDDTATRFDRHYRQLLLAEALYKNDYAQTDREGLQQAVTFFDSLTAADTRGENHHPRPRSPEFRNSGAASISICNAKNKVCKMK